MAQSAFYTGLSGLRAHSAAINVIGNNLANVNTVGYKSGRASFADYFNVSSARLGGNGSTNQVGLGVGMIGVQQLFNQGALQPTEVETDLALQGNGFFYLKTPDGMSTFSRAGNFSFNANGDLVDPNGNRVQGYIEKDSQGRIIPTGAIGDINIPVGMTAPPAVTSYFEPRFNLNSEAQVDDPNTAVDESEPFQFSVGTSVYDSRGVEHNLTIQFVPQDSDGDGRLDQWSWEARVPREDLDITINPGDPDYYVVDSGTMTFDGDGKMVTPAGNISLSIPAWASGASAQTVEWRLYDSQGSALAHSYAENSAVESIAQDGYGLGRLHSLSIGPDGLVSGVFTNGQTLELAQIAIASFNNPDGLFRRGDNTYLTSVGSGQPAIGTAQTGGRGAVVARALELSNVDITEQFTSLIVAERGYQSNSRVITTADEILQETLSIKR
ncbi:MAG: flagellar hook protein FlgE [Acidobacteriota bacterium]|nr:flagellar hook protein FlgE [Acidobacteriota bacterium]